MHLLTSTGYALSSGFWAGITGTVPPTTTLPPIVIPPTPTPTPTPGPTPTPQPTTFGVTINDGALYTNDPNVVVRAWGPNVTRMILSNDDGFVDADWSDYQITSTWVLSTYGNLSMPRLVYVRFRDAASMEYGTYPDNIVYDPVAPEGSVSILGGETETVTLWLESWDDYSGVAEMRLSETPTMTQVAWQAYANTAEWVLSGTVVYAQFRDQAGNESLIYSSDITPPEPGGSLIYLPIVMRDYSPPVPLRADFTASPTSGVAPLTVAFTNASTGSYTESLWDFGDGITSTLQNSAHVYAVTGTYTVSLTVSKQTGSVVLPGESNTLVRPNYITVTDKPLCDEKVINGGFEASGGWSMDSGYPAGYVITPIHSGSYAMRAGILDPAANTKGTSAFRQQVTLPSKMGSATVRFWLYPILSGTAPDGDEQRVLLLDQLGNTITTLVKQRSNTQAWTPYEFDLTQYAGNTLKLYFGVYNNGSSNVTAMYVDDVSLQVCPAP